MLRLNSSILLNGSTYPFRLSVTNFVGAEATASFAVTRAGAAVPLVYVAGPQARRVTRASPLRLAARAQLSACGAPSAVLDFAWRLTDGPGVSSWPGGREGASLFLAPFALQGGGRYEVTLYGSVRGGATTTFGVSVEVVAQKLVAIIAGGDRRVSASLPLVLDASGSPLNPQP